MTRETLGIENNNEIFKIEKVDKCSNSLLHLLAIYPNLNLIQRTLQLRQSITLLVNESNRLAIESISQAYLTSKKSIMLATKIEVSKSFRSNGIYLFIS